MGDFGVSQFESTLMRWEVAWWKSSLGRMALVSKGIQIRGVHAILSS